MWKKSKQVNKKSVKEAKKNHDAVPVEWWWRWKRLAQIAIAAVAADGYAEYKCAAADQQPARAAKLDEPEPADRAVGFLGGYALVALGSDAGSSHVYDG